MIRSPTRSVRISAHSATSTEFVQRDWARSADPCGRRLRRRAVHPDGFIDGPVIVVYLGHSVAGLVLGWAIDATFSRRSTTSCTRIFNGTNAAVASTASAMDTT